MYGERRVHVGQVLFDGHEYGRRRAGDGRDENLVALQQVLGL